MIRQQSQIAEAEDGDSGDEDSEVETGTNLHASLLMLACYKQVHYDIYYCKCAVWRFCSHEPWLSVPDFVFFLQSCETKSATESLGSRLVIMPTSHESICCCEGESVVTKKEEDEGFDSVCLNVWALQ